MKQALDPETKNVFVTYYAIRTLAEKTLWEFADSHPNIDVTSRACVHSVFSVSGSVLTCSAWLFPVVPPFFYGPFAPSYRNPDASIRLLSTNAFVYMGLMSPQGYPPPTEDPIGRWIDVRDVALACVLALTAPPSSAPGIGRKRLLISGEWFSFGDTVDHLAVVRPELKTRLSQRAKEYPREEDRTLVDNARAKEVLGLSKLRTWKETIPETVDSLLALEKDWNSKGLKPHF